MRLLGPESELASQRADLGSLVDRAAAGLDTYLRQMLAQVGSPECEISVPTDPIDLYVIGMCLTCEDCEKQEILEARTVAERLEKGIRFLREELDALAQQIESEAAPSPEADVDRAKLN